MDDRYRHVVVGGAALARFVVLFDSIVGAGRDEDWRDVALSDSDEWSLNANPDRLSFAHVVDGDQCESPQKPDRAMVAEFADLFLRHDLAAIRASLNPAG